MYKFILFIFFFFPLYVSAAPLDVFVAEKLNHPVLNGAWWGGIATYSDGEILFSSNENMRLTPASTLKLLTSAAALDVLGPHHRFETKLYAQHAPDSNGTLQGNLYIQGGADPTLGSTRTTGSLSKEEVLNAWVKAVQKAGIKKITGNIYADISLFEGISIPNKVNWENMGNYYAAPASALSFNDNSFRIHFKPQPFSDKPAEISHTEPEIAGLDIESYVTTDGKNKKDNAYAYAAPKQYLMKIYGTIPTNFMGFSINAAMPDPALYTVQMLKQALLSAGISVQGSAQTTTEAVNYDSMLLLHTLRSLELKDILIPVNKRSFNLYAEMLLRHLALHQNKKGSIENGLKELNSFLQKNKIIKPNEAVLYDGSGLSRDNMLTPKALLNTLLFMEKHPHFKHYYNSLATPDDRGDLLLLRRFLKPLKKVESVRIKGGTIDGVKAAAGYVKDKNGNTIAFVFMANNLADKNEAILRIHEDIIKQLLSSER